MNLLPPFFRRDVAGKMRGGVGLAAIAAEVNLQERMIAETVGVVEKGTGVCHPTKMTADVVGEEVVALTDHGPGRGPLESRVVARVLTARKRPIDLSTLWMTKYAA